MTAESWKGSRLDVNKWRIRRDPRFGDRWVIFAPGYLLKAAFVGNSFGHCVSALPFLIRIDRNWRILRRGR